MLKRLKNEVTFLDYFNEVFCGKENVFFGMREFLDLLEECFEFFEAGVRGLGMFE